MLADIFLRHQDVDAPASASGQLAVVGFKESDDVAPLRRSPIRRDVVVQDRVSTLLKRCGTSKGEGEEGD